MKNLILITVLAASFSVQAEFRTGNQLLSDIESTSSTDRAETTGYVLR